MNLKDRIHLTRQRGAWTIQGEAEAILDLAECADQALSETHQDLAVKRAISHIRRISELADDIEDSAERLDTTLQEWQDELGE